MNKMSGERTKEMEKKKKSIWGSGGEARLWGAHRIGDILRIRCPSHQQSA